MAVAAITRDPFMRSAGKKTGSGPSCYGSRKVHHRYIVLLTAMLLSFSFSLTSPSLSAEESCRELAGQIVSIESRVFVQPVETEAWHPASLNQDVCEGDTVRVGERSRAAIQLINDAVLRLSENTTLRLLNVAGNEQERSLLDVVKGTLKSFIRKPRTLTVNTPYLNGLIEGTEFQVTVTEEISSILVLEGQILAQNDKGNLRIVPGEKAEAGAGEAPAKVLVVKPRDAVQWAIHVPTLADFSGADLNDPVFIASSALAIGHLSEASDAIAKALETDPQNSDAHALNSIVALASNDIGSALKEAGEAVRLNSSSATGYIALSYAHQAQFDLDGALEAIESAIARDPENAYAWSRRSELQASFGNIEEALASARKAAEVNPGISRTQSVLGFAYLNRMETGKAQEAFMKAINLDPADPMPRLGLGLVKIGEGHLAAGRGEIDVAVGLDPNQSILRSYLGKGYYEEKRSPLDEQQFSIARDLDPKDPTPWFYQAIALQTSNRPVQALDSLETAIELNDNRAVYRSRLLLDSDLASRSASIGRIYSDLGFQELALREGWKSVNTDPTNFSAHRLLADSYSVLPRHEIARVSELLQSQLLQPLNMTPIQPRLSVSNLALISAGGPGSLSFNEFNPVFNRDGYGLQASLVAGENGTSGEEAVISGLSGSTSYSLGAFHYETDGFRDNADQQDDIANLFVQHEFSPEFSVQSELRYRDSQKGDLLLRFFPEDIYETQRQSVETVTGRIGAKYAFNPASVVLASFTYQEEDDRTVWDPYPIPYVSIDLDWPEQRSMASEIQHLYRAETFNITSGAGYFDVDSEAIVFQRYGPPLPPAYWGEGTFNLPFIVHHTNAYSYSNLRPLDDLTVTLGVSYDRITGDLQGLDGTENLNPKFGVTWEPVSGTTLRAAAFKAVKRTLVTNQTLEPTQVAGFNQFYDDEDLSESRRYGAAIDQKFSGSFSGGVEYSERELTNYYVDSDVSVKTTDWEESLWRAYIFWAPINGLSFSAKYEYEELTRDQDFPMGVIDSETHRLPLGINYFHDSGFSVSLVATYIDQKGLFGNEDFAYLHSFSDPTYRAGSDDFWIVDATFSFRLPKRYGLFTIGAKNLTDEEFNYFDQDLNNASIQPKRMAFARLTLSLF